MNKSELKTGAIVELRDGNQYIVCDTELCALDNYLLEHLDLNDYDEDLTFIGDKDLDVVKVYNRPLNIERWTWERKYKPSEEDITFLKMLDPKWKWIVMNPDWTIQVSIDKPIKKDGELTCWSLEYPREEWQCLLKQDMFRFLSYTDKEPINIQELIKEYEDGNTKA